MAAHPNSRSIDAGPVVVQAEDLLKTYGDFTAVDRINFAVQRGETFGMLGPNGAGKTSTMRMLTCVSPVTSGRLSVDGLDVMRQGRQIRDRLGVTAQHDGLDPDLTVRQNLLIHARFYGVGGGDARKRADEMLAFFGLDGRAESKVDDLSGGMKRRLTLARAFVTRPSVVVMDEPTTGLDPHSRNTVWEQLARMKSGGATIIMSTHYMEEAQMLCDRLVIMDQGRILAEGTPADLVRRFAGEETAVIRPAPGRKAKILEGLEAGAYPFRDRGAIITVHRVDGNKPELHRLEGATVSFRPSDLEDVFLSLTGRALRGE